MASSDSTPFELVLRFYRDLIVLVLNRGRNTSRYQKRSQTGLMNVFLDAVILLSYRHHLTTSDCEREDAQKLSAALLLLRAGGRIAPNPHNPSDNFSVKDKRECNIRSVLCLAKSFTAHHVALLVELLKCKTVHVHGSSYHFSKHGLQLSAESWKCKT